MLRTVALWAAILLCACLPSAAQAGQAVRLSATLTPERLGHGTTVGFAFEIAAPPNRVPPPLTGLDLSYPGNLGFALSGLGLATCLATTLAVLGPEGCPAESRMGYGAALAEIPVGPLIVREPAEVAIVRTIDPGGRLALLFYADGEEPVSAQIVFPGVLVPAPAPFGGQVHVDVPLVPSLPEAPDVAIVRLRATLGPQHLTYYRHVNGRAIPYNPKGILLPKRCPRGGFPFAGRFTFVDGSTATAHTSVACPA
jgi:hypothetical protein